MDRGFADMPGDSAITRGDQIRKRNIYCRRRTWLSSFCEIIRPEKRERERKGIICMVLGEAYSLERWTENTYGCRTELNGISCSIWKACEQVREKEAIKTSCM